jgi:copper(I)-binding protein
MPLLADEAGGGSNSAAYMVIKNSGDEVDRLVGVESPVADRVEVHETRMVDDVMRMRRLGELDLLPGDSVKLAPGGIHVMLMGLTRSLLEGDSVELTLRFGTSDPLFLNLDDDLTYLEPKKVIDITSWQDFLDAGSEISNGKHHPGTLVVAHIEHLCTEAFVAGQAGTRSLVQAQAEKELMNVDAINFGILNEIIIGGQIRNANWFSNRIPAHVFCLCQHRHKRHT